MRYSVAIRRETPGHVYFGLFVNGSLSGELCMRLDEFEEFKETIGIEQTGYEIFGWE